MPISHENGVGSNSHHVNGHVATLRNKPIHVNRHLRVICVGAGASGIYLAYKLKHYFTDFSLHIYEKNPDLGGTWYENRYPGCACDVPAHNYTYSFEPKHDWSANYASSSEIYQYFKDFVHKYDLRQYLHCSHKITGARWDDATKEWTVTVRNDAEVSFEKKCDFLINAAGILNAWRYPAIPGLQGYQGTLVHSANWDEKLDVTGKHVGLIGNGSSGIQILPKMQQKAAHVTTFIREPAWISPTRGMEYHQYTQEEMHRFKTDPEYHVEQRKNTERGMGSVFPLFILGSKTQDVIVEYMRGQMRQKINNDALSEKLIPDFAVGCRRLTPGISYLESLTLPNVTTIYGEIKKITAKGCVTEDGIEHPTEVLICATGFDTSFKPRFHLIGRHARNLAEEWATEPRSYLGLGAADFPNYFMFLGPNCPIGNGPIIFSIEIQGEYMAQFLNRWQKEDILSFEPKREAVDDFMLQKDLFMENTVWNTSCQSWYKNGSAKGKITALWPGSTLHYMETLASPRWDDFEIKYKGNRFAYLGNGFSQTELNPAIDVAYYIRSQDNGESLCRSSQSTVNVKDSSRMMKELHLPSL